MRILIIETDLDLSNSISENLKGDGYQSDLAESVEDAKYLLDIRNYNLILLDWNMPGVDSGAFIKSIKDKQRKTSVIVLSSDPAKESEIEALKSGADDYVVKPVDMEILQARIEAKMRFGASNIIEINELIISPEEEKIIYDGEDIELKGKPFEVLTHLAMHRDQIVSKEQLLDAIWEEPELVTPNVIEVAINQIRQKMDKPLNITTIETVRRRGYRFCFPDKV